MAEKRFIIEVRTKGFSRATKDFDKLDKSSKEFGKAQKRIRNNTTGLIGELGSLRNKILVYTFAIGGAVGAMNRFISAASGFQDVQTRLVGLTGSVAEAEKAFDTFNQVAATTPFQLQDVVNAGAQLEAFGVDSKATLSAVTDLAAFMGTTATEAASSLGRAFAGGAGAAALHNLELLWVLCRV
jgi:phage tail tape-measure protein